MRQWEIKRETVYRLYLDGEAIRDTDGNKKAYDSEEEAAHVAANWDLFKAPTMAQLRTMSDEELAFRTEGTRRHWGWFSR